MKDGKVEKKYTFDFNELNLPLTFVDDYHSDPQETALNLLRNDEYIYALTEITEGKKYLLFNTNKKIYILDKEEKFLQTIHIIQYSNLPIYSSMNISIGNSNGMFASFPSSYSLEKTKESISTNKANELSQEQKDFIMSIKEDDNPVLFIYQLK